MNLGNTNGPVKLLIFIHDLAPFGAQRIALSVAENLDREKISLTVFSLGRDETLAPAFEACGAKVVLLRAGRFLDLSAWYEFFRLILELKPDIVQTNLAEMSVPVRLFSVFMPGTKVIHTVHNPLSSEPFYWRFLNRATLFLCDLVIFCSESVSAADAFTRRLTRGTRVIRNGISIEKAPEGAGLALRGEFGIPRAVKTICCVGRLVGQKGQDILIEALALLVSRGRDLDLLLAGDGEDLGKLKALALKRGVSGKAVFLGRRSDIASILSASDIYAAPSRWEGFGLSLGEAMAAGLPCVGSEIAGHADFLKDGVTGLAVPPEDPAALAAAIARLLDNPPEASKLAAAGRDLVSKHFSMGEMAAKYEKIYLELASGPRK